jgi:putative alpha-1,2-mannosidase
MFGGTKDTCQTYGGSALPLTLNIMLTDPQGRSGNDNGLVQGGSNSDNVLADAYAKGLRGKINWSDGYAAMVKNAEAPTNGSNKEGRGAGADWLQYGYVSEAMPRSISRTVEYSLNGKSVERLVYSD